MKHTIICTRNPSKFPFPVFPPLETVWDPTAQKESINDMPEKFVCWSETLLNAIGDAVEYKKFYKEDFLILLDSEDELKGCLFSENGIIQEPWEYGFFLPQY